MSYRYVNGVMIEFGKVLFAVVIALCMGGQQNKPSRITVPGSWILTLEEFSMHQQFIMLFSLRPILKQGHVQGPSHTEVRLK